MSRQPLISIEPGKGSGTFADLLSSIGVNLVQSTVVKVGVMMKAKMPRGIGTLRV
jgi:hypothetical protein